MDTGKIARSMIYPVCARRLFGYKGKNPSFSLPIPMANLGRSVTFFLLFFTSQTSTSPSACPPSTCGVHAPSVRFPFRLSDHQASYCGCNNPGFDLSCTQQKQTILTLPSSGGFIVHDINYIGKSVWIDDPESCFAKRFLIDRDFTLLDSPFGYLYGLENYTFLNCSSQLAATWNSSTIRCLSGEYYKVIAVPFRWFYADLGTTLRSSMAPASLLSICSVISTVLVPKSDSFNTHHFNNGVQLAWQVPDCLYTEAKEGVHNKATSSSVIATNTYSESDEKPGLSKTAVHDISLTAEVIWGILGLLCFIVVVYICCCNKALVDSRPVNRSDITELSIVANPQPSNTVGAAPTVVRMGLDHATIASYPKTELGACWELPRPNDNTCSICLSEYQRKDTLRTISQCNHYFHASCIDEWFTTNATCPLCRNPPH